MNVIMHRPPLKRINIDRIWPSVVFVAEDDAARGVRQNRQDRIWDAITATAQASQQGEGE